MPPASVVRVPTATGAKKVTSPPLTKATGVPLVRVERKLIAAAAKVVATLTATASAKILPAGGLHQAGVDDRDAGRVRGQARRG